MVVSTPCSSVLNQAGSDVCLGFDFGVRKIGVAVGSRETGIANPLLTVQAIRKQPDWQKIAELVEEWRPGALVVGICYSSDGSENPVTPAILRFCRQLEGRFRLPVYNQDEQLTTYEAKQLLFDDIGVNAKNMWRVQDQLAAQLILQTWLNDVCR